jgi:Protein of unknown function (DUF4230)
VVLLPLRLKKTDMKKIGRKILYLAIIVIAYWLLSHFNILPSFSSIFKPKPVLIDDTPILVEEIKKISQLVTITVFDEVVVQQEKTNTRYLNNPDAIIPIPYQSTGKLVLIGRGRVLAGIDFKKLLEKDCFIKGDSVSVKLPKAEILTAIMNPSDFETFSETGRWSAEDVTAVKLKAREKLISRAMQQDISGKAGAKSRQATERFLRLLGFTRIHISGG